MKRTVYWLTTENHNCGTDTELFGSKGELDARLIAMMEEAMESSSEPDACDVIRGLIAEGKVEDAWEIFCNGEEDKEWMMLKHPDDYFTDGKEEVDFPEVAKGAL